MGESLARELAELGGESSLATALRRAGVIALEEDFRSVALIRDWHRAGAETFQRLVDIELASGVRRYVVKAIVSFSVGDNGVSGTLRSWMERRRLLEQAGVRVPQLLFGQSGVFAEEYIERTALEYLQYELAPSAVEGVLFALASRVFAAGFRPVCIVPNLRGDDRGLCWVDFGADLGGSVVGCPTDEHAIFDLVRGELVRYGMRRDPPDGASR